MTGPELRPLLDIRYRHAPLVTIVKLVPDALLIVPDNQRNVVNPRFCDRLENISEERLAYNGKHWLWPSVCERGKPAAFTGRENDGLYR